MTTAKTSHDVTETRHRPGTTLLTGIAAVIVAVLVVGLVLTARERTYAAGSPEAAAQGYLAALLDDDERTARTYLAPELIAECDSRVVDSFWLWGADSVRFTGVVVDEHRADLTLEFTYSEDYDPFRLPISDPWRSSHTADLQLERHNDRWLVVGSSWLPAECQER